MHKFLKIALIALGFIGTILWFQLPDAEMPASEAVESTSMSLMFMITYLLLAVAIFSTLYFAVKRILSSKAVLMSTLKSLGGLLGVVLLSYILSSGSDVSIEEMANLGIETTESTIKNIGMGLNVFFILMLIAVVLMVGPGIKRVFKK
jgi:membrane protease YdiL (CAAX protease family)